MGSLFNEVTVGLACGNSTKYSQQRRMNKSDIPLICELIDIVYSVLINASHEP